VLHCHGGSAGCADSSSPTAAIIGVALAPTAPLAVLAAVAQSVATPAEVSQPTPDQPPRSA
jgi:hypothetical protein